MKVFIGMETSGELRRRFAAQGHQAVSCDILPSDDGADRSIGQIVHGGYPDEPEGWRPSGHLQGDVFAMLHSLAAFGWRPDLAIFHPTCTLHTVSAAWAYSDPDFEKYPGVGYHQRVQPGTLVGAARRAAREEAEAEAERIRLLPIPLKVVENPRGTLSSRTRYGKPSDVLQPFEFGEDASKATCVWVFDRDGNKLPLTLPRDPAKRVRGRLVNGVERWANQTDTGQNRLSPGDDRWKERSKTYPGIADALAQYFGVEGESV